MKTEAMYLKLSSAQSGQIKAFWKKYGDDGGAMLGQPKPSFAIGDSMEANYSEIKIVFVDGHQAEQIQRIVTKENPKD